MNIAVFSTKPYDRRALLVNDHLSAEVIATLAEGSVRPDPPLRVFARLLTFPNMLITGHQGFFTREALGNIAEMTLANATAFESGEGELHRVTLEEVMGER